MALLPTFHLELSKDALSFLLIDTTEDYDEELNPGGFGGDNPLRTDITGVAVSLKIPGEDSYSTAFKVLDIETENFPTSVFLPEDFDINTPIFKDGVYSAKVTYNVEGDSYESEEEWFGFTAVITNNVVKSSLNYSLEQSVQQREWILEQHRLLSNLRYSTETGNIEHFRRNLEQLQKIRQWV